MSLKVLVSFRNPNKVEPYFAALRAAGIEPAPCTPGSHPNVGDVQGIVFTGGSDILPSYYGQDAQPELDIDVDHERDAFELGLLTMADAVDLPALCICRGLQLLNVHRGGTLFQHLRQSPHHRRTDTPKPQAVHAVKVDPSSKLAAVLGTCEAQVNSRHHQAIDRLGGGLAITARDVDDGVIEAAEDPERRFLLGVQWHPEDQAPDDDVQRRLFSAFAAAL